MEKERHEITGLDDIKRLTRRHCFIRCGNCKCGFPLNIHDSNTHLYGDETAVPSVNIIAYTIETKCPSCGGNISVGIDGF